MSTERDNPWRKQWHELGEEILPILRHTVGIGIMLLCVYAISELAANLKDGVGDFYRKIQAAEHTVMYLFFYAFIVIVVVKLLGVIGRNIWEDWPGRLLQFIGRKLQEARPFKAKDHLLDSIKDLPPERLRQFRRELDELDRELAAAAPQQFGIHEREPSVNGNGKVTEMSLDNGNKEAGIQEEWVSGREQK